MRRLLTVLLAGACALVVPAAQAEKLYKWVSRDGSVSYRDRPPPQGSGYRVEEKHFGDRLPRASANASSPADRFPVVLYTASKCAPCDLARAYLDHRGIRYTVKNVESDPKLQAELEAKSGSVTVPTITVGNKVMNGYMRSLLAGELDQAGYPRSKDQGARGPAGPGSVSP